MKVKVDEQGILVLGRRGGHTTQFCHTAQFYNDEEECYDQVPCGDHCPLFGEPVLVDGCRSIAISICHGKEIRCLVSEFTDERVEGEQQPVSPGGGAKCLAS